MLFSMNKLNHLLYSAKYSLKFGRKRVNILESSLIITMTLITLVTCYQIIHTRYDIVIPTYKYSCLKNWHFGLIDKWDHTILRNETYIFKSRYMMIRKDGEHIAKFIRAMPLDEVEITKDHKIYINSKLVGTGLGQANLYKKSPNYFIRHEKLGFDKYWGLGTTYNSVDSRYWGALDESQVIGRFIPLF